MHNVVASLELISYDILINLYLIVCIFLFLLIITNSYWEQLLSNYQKLIRIKFQLLYANLDWLQSLLFFFFNVVVFFTLEKKNLLTGQNFTPVVTFFFQCCYFFTLEKKNLPTGQNFTN